MAAADARKPLSDAELDRRALDALDEALEWPPQEHEARLAELSAREPALATQLRKLLQTDRRASRVVPTTPTASGPITDGLPAPDRISVYRLTELLGQGGMGSVWRGERDDGLFAHSVAIKILRPGLFSASALAQFAVERRVLARLRHPNIAQLYDGGADAAGRAWFVMELVEGVTLADVAAERTLTPREAVELMLPVCAAVRHAHAALVVHADIKPANILVDAENRPKLLDFGIGRALEDPDEGGVGHGLTAPYASPARRAGEPPTPADDVYALGAVLWELLAGEPPAEVPPGRLAPAVPQELAAVVAKAAAADPVQRYDGVGALAEDLRRWRDGRPVQALPDSPLRSARLFMRRRPWVSVAAASGLLGLLAALAVISTLYQRSEHERAEADRRFEQARGMAHYMLFDLFDRLNDAPGTLPVRRELADRARLYLDDLSAGERAPVSVRADAAIGYMQLAGVQGLFAAGQLGEAGRGRTPLERAAALLEAAPPAARRDPQWRHAHGRLLLFQGFAADDQGGGAQTATRLLRSAVAELEQASHDLPSDAEAAVDLWQARLTLADVRGSSGDPAGEIAAARSALADHDRRRRLYDRHPKTPLLVARSHKRIGEALGALGDGAGAVREFSEAEAALLSEDRLRPRRTRTLFELMDAQWNLAAALAETGRPEDALGRYDRALAAGRARLLIEPEHESLQRLVTLVQSDRAKLLSRLGRHGEAVAAADESLAVRQRLADAQPQDQVARRHWLYGLAAAAAVEHAAGLETAACGHYRAAAQGFDTYLRTFSIAPQSAANEVAPVREGVARCGRVSGASAPPG